MLAKLSPLALLFALAACGADGPPEAPARAAEPKPGVTLSGDARLGVSTRF